jgi:hypothetical protein
MAADRLFIHHETLRRRLERIRQLTGLDLCRHEDRMRADFVLRQLQINGAGVDDAVAGAGRSDSWRWSDRRDGVVDDGVRSAVGVWDHPGHVQLADPAASGSCRRSLLPGSPRPSTPPCPIA